MWRAFLLGGKFRNSQVKGNFVKPFQIDFLNTI